MKNCISSNLAYTILSLPPSRIYKANAFISLRMMNRFFLENLKYERHKPAFKSELWHLPNSYVHNYKPSRSTFRNHGILRKFKSNKNIAILRSVKGNGVVVLDRIQYDNAIKEIISDKTKLKELPKMLLLNEKLNY